MKYLFFSFLFLVSFAKGISQKTNFNVQDGYLAGGYDLVAYFNQKPVKGIKKYSYKYKGALVKFSSEKNLKTFKKNPEKYLPQYGGWCAYAMADKELVSINPKTFEIRNGKLYLFYNAYFTNTFKKWKSEGAEKLRKKADINWKYLKKN